MKALGLVMKFGVLAATMGIASGTVKDVMMGVMDGAAVNVAHAQMNQLHGKLMEFYQIHNSYPKSLPELRNFMKQEFDTPLETVLYDPWKMGYRFFTPKVEILSWGPDKAPNTRDDIGKQYPPNVRRPNPNVRPANVRRNR